MGALAPPLAKVAKSRRGRGLAQKMLRLLLGCAMLLAAVADDPDDRWKVLLLMVDGCRWDYVTKEVLPGFQEMADSGVRAEYVQPVFPSNSYPNWYSIVTGLYPESHGFIDNEMYDERSGELFLMLPHPNASHEHWWNKAEPLWVTAESQHIRTALYWWGGCEVAIRGTKPRICVPHGNWFVEKQTLREKFREILGAFQKDQIDLAQLYYGHVDHFGHVEGPDSPERKQALQDIDQLLLEVQRNLTQLSLDKKVNIVVVSDHGMTPTGPGEVTFVDLNRFSHMIKLALGGGSRYWILPYPHQLDKLYSDMKKANLLGVNIYRKEEIPEKYHVKKNSLTLPLLVQAEDGFALLPLQDSRMQAKEKVSAGNHGYDPFQVEDMRTIFYARGPAFRKGYVSRSLQNVDHYNLLCHLLDITSLPNNGSWERVVDMLDDDDDDEEDYDDSDDDSAISTSAPKTFLVVFCLFIISFLRNTAMFL